MHLLANGESSTAEVRLSQARSLTMPSSERGLARGAAKLADHLVERDLHLVSLQELEVTGVAEAVLPEHASATLVRDAAFDGEPRLPRVRLNH